MPNNSEDWLDKAHRGLDTIFSVLWELRSLAEGFKTAGNPYTAKKLHITANKLEIAHKAIRDSISESIHESMQTTEQMTKTVVEAALAGCLLGEEDIKRDREHG